jgi:hypothetical protein
LQVVEQIPVEYDERELFQKLGIERIKGKKKKAVTALIRHSLKLLESKAIYIYIKVAEINGVQVILENGMKLESIVLSDLLSPGQTIAPYMVTIGHKLEDEVSRLGNSDVLLAWALDIIGSCAIRNARVYLKSIIKKTLGNPVSGFDPGSGTGRLFGIKQLPILFQLLPHTSKIGVRLTSTGSMLPQKTIAGIFAATKEEYVACQHCPRDCEFRRTPYKGEYMVRTGNVG